MSRYKILNIEGVSIPASLHAFALTDVDIQMQ